MPRLWQVRLGLGINTGAGVKDGSVGAKILGCGLQLGQKTGVSLFDNEVVVDFGKLFSSKNGPDGEEDELAGELSLLSCMAPHKPKSGQVKSLT